MATAKEKPIITEPSGFLTEEEALKNCNPDIETVMSFQAGMADGTVVTLWQLVSKSPAEIESSKRLVVQQKCDELAYKIAIGKAEDGDLATLQTLTSYLNI